jgi:hypothetical protein
MNSGKHLTSLPDELLVIIVAQLYNPTAPRAFAGIEALSRACKRLNSLTKDWRTLQEIAITHYPIATKIFGGFEVTPRNLVTLTIAASRCQELAHYLGTLAARTSPLPKYADGFRIIWYRGLVTAEMIRARKTTYQTTDYNFIDKIPWPNLMVMGYVALFAALLFNHWSDFRLFVLTAQCPRFAKMRALVRKDVILFSMLHDGVSLLEKIRRCSERAEMDFSLFPQLNWNCALLGFRAHTRLYLPIAYLPPADQAPADAVHRPDHVYRAALQRVIREMRESGKLTTREQLTQWGWADMADVSLERLLVMLRI